MSHGWSARATVTEPTVNCRVFWGDRLETHVSLTDVEPQTTQPEDA